MKTLFEELEELEGKDPLEKCISLLWYFLRKDLKDVNVLILLYNNGYNLSDEVIPSFKKYIDSNLFKYETIQAKEDYIKYIIYQFHLVNSCFESDIELNQSIGRALISGQKLDQERTNISFAWTYYVKIMNVVQEACFILNLDFITLCSELDFSLKTFDPVMGKIIRENKESATIKKNKGSTIKSFFWTGTPLQLRKLFDELIRPDHGFIDSEIDFKAFAAIFADELTGCMAIKWRASNRLLSYLFDQLYASGYIAREWQIVIDRYKLFKNSKGNLIKTGDLATALSNINDINKGLNPKGSEIIDEILKKVKSLRP